MFAADYNLYDFAKLLLEKGANVNAQNGLTPLMYAAKKGHQNMCQLLLENGANINMQVNNMTALAHAANHGQLNIACFLIEKGADVNTKGLTALIAATMSACLDIVDLLIQKGADVNAEYSGRTALTYAAEHGNFNIAKLLIEKGANVDAQYDGMTALMYAAKHDHSEIIKLLIANGANINAEYKGNNAMSYAILNRNVNIVNYLLEFSKVNSNLNGAEKIQSSPRMKETTVTDVKNNIPAAVIGNVEEENQIIDIPKINTELEATESTVIIPEIIGLQDINKNVSVPNKFVGDPTNDINFWKNKCNELEMQKRTLEEKANKNAYLWNLIMKSLVEDCSTFQNSSYIYYKEQLLDFYNQIHEEVFFDGGRGHSWRSLDEFKKLPVNNEREIILVDLKHDKSLENMVHELKEILPSDLNLVTCYKEIANFVHNRMGKFNLENFESHIRELKTSCNSNVLKIGEIRIGLCRHRAILFKFLCDRLTTSIRPLLCRLVRGYDEEEAHAWNVVYNSDDCCYYLVDVMHNPGCLLKEGSIECDNYKRTGGYTTGCMSVRNQIPIVNPNDVKKGMLLGRGSFGKVYACTIGNDNSYAMKIIELMRNEITDAANELNIMTFIHHENLMGLMRSYFTESNELVIIMKRMEYSGDKLIHETNVLNDKVQLIAYLLQVARGIRFLHRHNIIHRDLKPQNTLVTLQTIGSVQFLDQVKVSDFGGSKLLTGTIHANTIVQTRGYTAPELFTGQYNSKIDSYSFGIMIAEAACRSRPLSANLAREDFRKRDREILYELYIRCIEEEPSLRPDFEQIVRELQVLLAMEAKI